MSKIRRFAGYRRAVLHAACAMAALAVASARADTLVIGTVGKDVKSEIKEFTPLADHLKEQLSKDGVDNVEVLVVSTAAKMAEAFRDGKVHLYLESPLVALKVGKQGGAVPMLRRWKKGVAEYWSEIVVKSDSPIRSMDELRGRIIAFEDPDSTSGHLLPRALLLHSGFAVENVKTPAHDFDRSKVGAVFTMGDRTSLLWLFDDRVAAIATDPHYVARIEKERPGALRSLGRSITVPRQVVMRASTMPAARAQRLADVMTRMHETPEGRQTLASFGGSDRFDAFPDGIEKTFSPIEEQLRILDAERDAAASSN
jgi:phosphonate transport system substrate-binding protein